MQPVHQLLASVMRRLRLHLGLRTVLVALFFALCVAALAILGYKLFASEDPNELLYLAVMLLVPPAVATLIGVGVMIFRRPTALDAAVAVDERLGLKARISSALQVEGRTDPMCEAVVADAARWARRIDVRRAFPYRWPRLAVWIPLPLAIALLLCLVPAQDVLGLDMPEDPALKTERAAIRQAARRRRMRVRQFKEKVSRAKKSRQISGLTRELGEMTEDVQKKGDLRTALKEINKLKSKVAEERKRLDHQRDIAKMAQILKKMAADGELGQDPLTRELGKALRQGDLQKAARELKRLKEMIKEKIAQNQGKLTREEKQQLERTLQKLAQAADRMKGMRALKDQLQAGGEDLMENLQDAMEGLEITAEQLAQLDDLTQQLQDGQDDGDQDDGLDPLEALENQLAILDEMVEGLDDFRDEIGECSGGGGGKAGQRGRRRRLGRGQGQGRGKGQRRGAGAGRARGSGRQDGSGPFREGKPDQQGAGSGGPGRGRGGNPGENDGDELAFKKVRAAGQFHKKGKIIGSMIYKGIPPKGEARKDYEQRLRAARQAAQDSLVRSKVPRVYEEMVKRYFDDISPEQTRPGQADPDNDLEQPKVLAPEE